MRNAYCGVLHHSSIFLPQHDRGWTERDVFGTVRYMNDRGLERKFDMEAYLDSVEKLVEREREEPWE